MNVQRSPTGCSSQPDLSKLGKNDNITLRKRKQPDDDHNCPSLIEIQTLRTDMSRITTLLENFIVSNKQTMDSGFSDLKNQITTMKIVQEQAINTLSENLNEVKIQINDIKSSVTNMATEQNQMKNNLTQLESKVTTGEHKLKSIENDLINLRTDATIATPKTDQILQELQDRINRRKNILLAGFPEQSSSLNPEEKRLNDRTQVINIINHSFKDMPQPTAVFRVGKYSATKNRRIKVCFSSEEPVRLILSNKGNLPEGYKIYSDETPSQQKHLQSLKDELNRRLENGENNLTIKYVKGVPNIVECTSKN